MESNLSGDTALAANVIISCIIYTSIVFIVSLVIKISLRTCQDRLTFISHADDAKYHLTSLSMEIVEITEQYCYTMNIGISTKKNDNIFSLMKLHLIIIIVIISCRLKLVAKTSVMCISIYREFSVHLILLPTKYV